MSRRPPSSAIAVGLAFFIAAGLACGKKGDPRPPLRPTPATISGLRLAQRGDQVEIRFTAPRASTDGARLPVLDIELFVTDQDGDFAKLSRSRRFKAAPGEVLTETEPLPAPGTSLRAAARAIAKGHKGTLPAPARLVVVAPLAAPSDLSTKLVGDGVALGWQGEVPAPLPTPTPGPTPVAPPDSAGAVAAAGEPAVPPAGESAAPPAPGVAVSPEPTPTPTPLRAPPPAGEPLTPPAPAAAAPPEPTPTPTAQPAPPPGGELAIPPIPGAAASPVPKPTPTPQPTPPPFDPGFFIYKRQAQGTYAGPLQDTATVEHTFVDRTALPGESSCYTVRAVAAAEPLVESAASNEACVDVKDVLAPAVPTGLTLLPREEGIELSWSPSPESDLAGYRVYRAAERGAPQLLAELPRAVTSFLDKEAPAGRLRYSVTAVDLSGNESAKSPPLETRRP